MGITIIIIDSGEDLRKKLKDAMPKQVRASLDQAGLGVEMESGEQMRAKLPDGLPNAFVTKEEILVFPQDEEEPSNTKSRRRRMTEINNRLRRKKLAGNTEK